MIKKMIKKLKTAIFIFLGTTQMIFSMSIGPIYFSQRIDGNGGYQEYEIDNPTFSNKRYKIQLLSSAENKKERDEINKWIEVYPKVLTVPPKSTGKIKVLIKASSNAKVGEYEFTLLPTPITIPTLENSKNDKKIANVAVKAPLHFSMGLKGYVGDLGSLEKDLKIEKVKTNSGLKVKIKNNLKREVVLDVLVTEHKDKSRDVLKIKSGEEVEKLYSKGQKLEIKEAPTQKDIKTIF